jgi:hypothetical protein
MLNRIPHNVKSLQKIDAHLDLVDELLFKMDLPRSVKHNLHKYTYEMYAALEAAIDEYTPSN